MSAAAVVWMDKDNARILNLSPGRIEKRILRRQVTLHHTFADVENHKDTEKFFAQLASELKGIDQILLMGPGLAKDNFKSHLERHHQEGIARKIVGSQTVDHISEGEMLALSRRFFKVYDLFYA